MQFGKINNYKYYIGKVKFGKDMRLNIKYLFFVDF